MQIYEPVRMALQSILANKLRAALTLLSMSIGVFAIIGVATAVGALDNKLKAQLESFGTTTFMITRTPVMNFGDGWARYRNRKDITLRQGQELGRRLTGASMVSLQNQTMGIIVKYGREATDPKITVYGGDEAWLALANFDIASGRNLTPDDIQLRSDVAVVGPGVVSKLFKDVDPIGHSVTVGGHRYLIIGVTVPKGAIFGQSQDDFVLVPITSATKYFVDEWESSITISVRASSEAEFEELQGQTIGIMRALHRLRLGEENDFEISTNESLSETFGNLTEYVSYFGVACGVIALLAAGVGIMNIMLVSVKERTREIGVRKAIGATRGNILSQFIIEALTLCQLGALIGIGLGLLGGAALASGLEAKVSFPWGTASGAIIACTVIGLIFGIYPAWKAARLDPIDALRYE